MLWSPATARVAFRDDVEIQSSYNPKDKTIEIVIYTHRAEYIKNQ